MRKYLPTPKQLLAIPVAAGFLLLSGLVAIPAQAQEAPPGGFPSWSEVKTARGNAVATAAEIAKIAQALAALESETDLRGTAAVQAGVDYVQTLTLLDAVTAEVDVLNAQTQRASAQAGKDKKDAVSVAVQRYKRGGTGLGLFATMTALETPESLNGVELLQLVGEQAALKHARARESQAAAEAMEQNRHAAQQAQLELSTQALQNRDAATAARNAVTEQLQTKESHGALLFATGFAEQHHCRQGAGLPAGAVRTGCLSAGQSAKRAAAAEAVQRAAQNQQKPAMPSPVRPPVHQPALPAIPNPGRPAVPNLVPNPVTPGKPVKTPAPVVPKPGSGYIPVDELLPNIPGAAVNDPAGAKTYASARLAAYGWSQGQFQCLNQLWERESNWRTNATNPYSGAYGIAQALPPGKYGDAGADWLSNYRTQIQWGLGYIKDRYGSPCGAWDHSQRVGWY